MPEMEKTEVAKKHALSSVAAAEAAVVIDLHALCQEVDVLLGGVLRPHEPVAVDQPLALAGVLGGSVPADVLRCCDGRGIKTIDRKILVEATSAGGVMKYASNLHQINGRWHRCLCHEGAPGLWLLRQESARVLAKLLISYIRVSVLFGIWNGLVEVSSCTKVQTRTTERVFG